MQPTDGIHLHHEYATQQLSEEHHASIPADAITEPEQIRKVFIGGLGQQVTSDHLDAYFSNFGRLTDCVVMKDPNGRSRGFGFVTFTHKHMVDACMAARPHVIEGKEVDAKRAMPKDDSVQGPVQQINVRKLFVGGIREGLSEEDLKAYFSKYGDITDCVVMRNGVGAVRGFGFIQFSDSDAVDQVVLQGRHLVSGQDLDVKKAIPKAPGQSRSFNSSFRPSRRGGSRFYDAYPATANNNDPYQTPPQQTYSDYHQQPTNSAQYMPQQHQPTTTTHHHPSPLMRTSSPAQHQPYNAYDSQHPPTYRMSYRGSGGRGNAPYAAARNTGPYARRERRPQQRFYRGDFDRRY